MRLLWNRPLAQGAELEAEARKVWSESRRARDWRDRGTQQARRSYFKRSQSSDRPVRSLKFSVCNHLLSRFTNETIGFGDADLTGPFRLQ